MTRSDDWLISANLHLRKHILARMSKAPRRYGDPGELHVDMGRAPGYARPPSDEFIARVARLVEAKNLWAKDMQDMDRGEGVPIEMQKEIWTDYVKRAEAK